MLADYYGKNAYTPQTIPDQQPEPEKAWLLTFGKIRLPWGNTSQAVPIDSLTKFQVKNLRYIKKNYSLEKQRKIRQEANDLGAEFNHECYRMPHITWRLTLIGFLMTGGKGLFIIAVPVMTFAALMMLIMVGNKVKFTEVFVMWLWCLGIPLAIWKLSDFAFTHFKGFFFAKSLGPQYEFNRRTGIVTLYDKETKQASSYPFYEFDAYLNSFVSRQGIMQYQLYIVHRYSPKKMMSMYPLQGPSYNIEPHGAVWDFLQNYMDITKPLPDIPELEEYRALDPVTVQYDQQTNRPADYWLTIDEDTLKQKMDENGEIIFNLKLNLRQDIMQQYVKYQNP